MHPLSSFREVIAHRIDEGDSSFVLFRMPGEADVSMWVGAERTFSGTSATGDRSREGYIEKKDTEAFHFAPFDNQDCPSLLLKPSHKMCGWDDICRYLRCDRLINVSSLSRETLTRREVEICSGREAYECAFDQSMRALKGGSVHKMVLARQVSLPCLSASIVDYFIRALDRYPDTLVYLYHSPSIGCYAGASPELLIRAQAQKVYTAAIAGTMPAGEGCKIESWSPKNRAEHTIVVNYIEQILNEYCVAVKRGTTKPICVGTLSHLYTSFEGLLESIDQPSVGDLSRAMSFSCYSALLSSIAQTLHPTPAVCGLPTQEARSLIRDCEHTSRRYYSGYLGTFSDDSAALYVNIRCLHYADGLATLYAGGGLMPDSLCQDEWAETTAKLRATAFLL